MRVLHVYKIYYPDTFGGVERFISELSKGMLEKGIESSVFCLTSQKQEEEIIIDGIKVYKIPYDLRIASTPFSLKAFFRFRDIVKNFDVIHYHFPYPFQDLLHLFFGRGKKSLVTYHSDIVKQKGLYFFYKPIERLFLKSVDIIIATSQNYVKTSSVLQRYKEKVRIITYGIDQKNYPLSQESIVQKYKKQFGEKFFLFIGVLRYYKGLHTFIDAAKKNGLSVVIAGFGPLEKDLQKQAEKFENIHFIGPITEQEKVDLLSACYAFIFPSHLRSEAFGLSLVEAAMFQKPMITCEIGTGTSYVNIHNETGFVIPPEDSNALSNYMQALLDDDILTKNMGRKAYDRYRQLFMRDKMINAYEKVYRDLVS